VHPPLGKWLIAIGEFFFGHTNAFGWRFMPALIGSATILLTIILAKILFNNNLIALLSGLFLSLEGTNLVMSRTAMLDIFLAFFILLTGIFFCLWVKHNKTKYLVFLSIFGGMASSVKVSGAFLVIAIAIFIFFNGVICHLDYLKSFLRSLFVLAISFLTYAFTWVSWFFSSGGYNRTSYTGSNKILSAIISFFNYQKQIITSNMDLTDPHTYGSYAWQWIFNTHPTVLYNKNSNCLINSKMLACSTEVISLGNLALWLIFVFACLFFITYFFRTKNMGIGLLLIMFFSFLLPFFITYKRTIFQFYLSAISSFACIIVASFIGLILFGEKTLKWNRTKMITKVKKKFSIFRKTSAIFLILIIIVFACIFIKIWLGIPMYYDDHEKLMWLNTWK
jgi:dolichyl-phosphate-mannose--protein O-mannosyl transferase